MKRFVISALAIATMLACGASARAQSVAAPDDVVGSVHDAMKASGVDVSLSLTQFYQGLVVGDGDRSWEYGGKINAFVTLDGSKLGVWPGLTLSIHQEAVYGGDVNDTGNGSLLPINVAMAFPRSGGSETDTSIVLTQAIGDQLSLSLGKFNMLDAAARAPLLGGGGIDTFSHVGVAAPVSGVTPPYLLGASATLRGQNGILTFMVYDPRNAQDLDVVRNPFTDGTTFSLSATLPTTFGGLPGFQGARGVYSTQAGLDLADIPELALPDGSEGAIGEKKGYWYAAYSFQQYLSLSSTDPSKGWGLYGQIAVSDGNPNAVASSMYVGVGGNSPLPGRQNDLWGVAYFRYNLSDVLLEGLSELGIDLSDEQGAEAYYNLQLLERLRVSANATYVRPSSIERPDSVFIGLRATTVLF